MALQQLTDRLAAYFEAHPDARIGSSEGAARFGCTAYSLRQAMYLLRRIGVQVRCVRVYQMRRRDAAGKAPAAPADGRH